MNKSINVTIIGGGMITQDLILPVVYHLKRTGTVNAIDICALNSAPLKSLKENPTLLEAFPEQDFIPHPSLEEPDDKIFPDLYKDVLASMAPYQAVIVALPDQLHYSAVQEALLNNQHVLCVKPLVLKYEQAVEIERLAHERGLFVGVEYHKRFDQRALIARKEYRK